MKRVLLFALLLVCACQRVEHKADGLPQQAEALVQQAKEELDNQHFDAALEKGLKALETARQAEDPLSETRALLSIVGIDIMTSRDADAWEKALEAEKLARENGFRKELSEVLIAKAKLCSYAEISPETGRNDEGLQYAEEALQIAEAIQDYEQQAEACHVIGSLYINKNRWSNPIDPEIYRTAGEYLDKGQAIADTYNLPRLRRNGILFRSRWFQQDGRNEEAIAYFEQVLKGLKETDYVTAAALDDRLVRLYTRTGDAQKALDTHDDYVFRMQKYLQQKQDETLQEMETRFKVQEKEREIERKGYQISLLILLVLLAAAITLLSVGYARRVRRRNAELQRLSKTKEQIIDIISRDLQSPANGYASKLEKLAANPGMLNGEVATYVENAIAVRAQKIADIGLSQREIQIIRLSAQGLTAAEIAQKLYLSVHTVNTHRQRIYSKMDVKNVSDMLRLATELGII